MNEALTIPQDCPSSGDFTESGTSSAATRELNNHQLNPKIQEDDLLDDAEHEHPQLESQVAEVANLERHSLQGSIIRPNTNERCNTDISNRSQTSDEETPDFGCYPRPESHSSEGSVSESADIGVSADDGFDADSNDSHGNQHPCPAKPLPQWTPLALRRPVLLAFSGLLLSMIAGMEALNYVSNQNQGLATVVEKRYYLWKFGPTFGEYYVAINYVKYRVSAKKEQSSPFLPSSGPTWNTVPSKQCHGCSWPRIEMDPMGAKDLHLTTLRCQLLKCFISLSNRATSQSP